MLNGQLFTRCPKSDYVNNHELLFLVQTYLECRESKTLPAPGSWFDQTAYATELFIFLDEHVGTYKDRMMAEHEREMKKQSDKMKARPKGK